MKTVSEKVDDAVHAALAALGISAKTTPTFAEDLNDWLSERAPWVITDDDDGAYEIARLEALTIEQVAAMTEDQQEDILAAIFEIEDSGDLPDTLVKLKQWLHDNGKAVAAKEG